MIWQKDALDTELANSLKQSAGQVDVLLIRGDSPIRAPDYGYQFVRHYLCIFESIDEDQLKNIARVGVDFPCALLLPFSQSEIASMPGHLRSYGPLRSLKQVNSTTKEPNSDTCWPQHALAEAAHIVRRHVLADATSWNTIWGNRFIPWAARVVAQAFREVDEFEQHKTKLLNQSTIDRGNALQYANETLWGHFDDEPNLTTRLIALNTSCVYLSKRLNAKNSARSHIQYHQTEVIDAIDLPSDIVSHVSRVIISTLGDNLFNLSLSGSTARNEAQQGSDLDFIIIVNELHGTDLLSLRNNLNQYKGVNVHLLSLDDLCVYPAYRFHSITSNVQLLFGKPVVVMRFTKAEAAAACLNTIFNVMQVSREYFLRPRLNRRALASIRWQAKMLYSSFFRILPVTTGGSVLNSRAEVRKYFDTNDAVQKVVGLIDNSEGAFDLLEEAFNNGDESVARAWLIWFSEYTSQQLRGFESHLIPPSREPKG